MAIIDLNELTQMLEGLRPPRTLGEYEFNQMVAEAKHTAGQDLIFSILCFFKDRYGWPIPDDKRGLVAAAIALIMAAITGELPNTTVH